MDPKATLIKLLTALTDEGRDPQAVYDAGSDLAEWVHNGGYLPAVTPILIGSTTVYLIG